MRTRVFPRVQVTQHGAGDHEMGGASLLVGFVTDQEDGRVCFHVIFTEVEQTFRRAGFISLSNIGFTAHGHYQFPVSTFGLYNFFGQRVRLVFLSQVKIHTGLNGFYSPIIHPGLTIVHVAIT